jgi:hypothetical protein
VTTQGSSLRLYDAETGEPRGPEVWLDNPVREHAFSADGRVLIVFYQGESKNVRFFDTRRGEELELAVTHDTAPHLGVSLNLKTSANGTRVLVWHKAIGSGARWSGAFSVWDTSILSAPVNPPGLLARTERQTGLTVSDAGAVEPISPARWQSLDKQLRAASTEAETR